MQIVRQRVQAQAARRRVNDPGNTPQIRISALASMAWNGVQQASRGFQQVSKGVPWEKGMQWAASVSKARLEMPKVRPGLGYAG